MGYVGLFIAIVICVTILIWLPMALVITYYINQFYNEDLILMQKDYGKRRKKVENIISICTILYVSVIIFFIMQLPK